MSVKQHARRYRVTGRVQGVFFRASTRERAVQLGVMGYAKNLPDGSVEVLAVGSEGAIAQLATWLWQGPPAASVQAVELLDEVTVAELSHFQVL